jgi:uncharacterized protein (TIGR02466 family)
MIQNQFNVIPLFPTPLIDFKVMELSNDVEKLFSNVKDSDWLEVNPWNNITKNKFILNDDANLLEKITELSGGLISSLLFTSNSLQITTSWFTRTPPNERGNPHSHTNSWWSGVYYFRDDTSPIKFEQFDRGVSIPHQYQNENEFNTSAFILSPQKGTLILFPSHLIHSIQKNNTNFNRHSLAFNIMPKGETGIGDSWFNFK